MTVVGLVCNFTTFNPWIIIWLFTEEKETSEKMTANKNKKQKTNLKRMTWNELKNREFKSHKNQKTQK